MGATGHTSVLHSWVPDSAPHAVPPFAASVVTVRVWIWKPVPQVTEQVSQSLHPEVAQLTVAGHSSVLHSRVPDRAPHAVPPFAAAVVTVRVHDWKPPPQVAEHAFQSLHPETAQLTGALVGDAVGAVVGALVGAAVG